MNSRGDGAGEPENEDLRPAGIEYHGVAGGSDDCQSAVVRLIQCGVRLGRVRILTVGNEHALLLCNEVGDQIAIKSGFTSGYGGTGPTAFSVTLELLNRENAEIDEVIVGSALLERLNESALTAADLSAIADSRPVRPGRWNDYVLERHFEAARDGALWRDFPPVIPFSIIDPRIMDLARDFWADPDSRLTRGYRRLEDAVRKRTGIDEIGAKLFSRAFGKTPVLGWGDRNGGETEGRAQLFAAVFMAYRNPRAHQEEHRTDQLAEFLLLNQLFRLEAEAVETDARPASGG